MFRKPLPSEIEEQKHEMTVLKTHNPIGYPGLEINRPHFVYDKPGRLPIKYIYPDNTFCKKCGKVIDHNCFTLFRTGFSCKCK